MTNSRNDRQPSSREGDSEDNPALPEVTLSGMDELAEVDLESGESLAHVASDVATPSFAKTTVPGLVDKQRYKITGEFARGGMGRILLAFDRATGREVAIKELIGSSHTADPIPGGGKLEATGPTIAGAGAMTSGAADSSLTASPPPDEITVERFLREAKITSRLEHPNIVPVYEIAQRKDGVWYYSMKFVRGVTLGKKLRDIARNGQLDERAKREARLKLIGPFIDVCHAIAYASTKGVIHRDLKPENIMLGEFGETVVLDWGLARIEGEDLAAATRLLSTKGLRTRGAKSQPNSLDTPGRSSSRLTLDGSVIGTPSYMPPEQAQGELEQVDHLSDVYSLGAILYEILAGTRAYGGQDAFDILDAVLAGAPPALASVSPDAPPELVAVVERAMARDKPSRFASAEALAKELEAWRDGRTVASYKYSTGEQVRRIVKRHRAVFATLTAALLVLVVGGVFALWSINAEKNEAEQAREKAESVSTELVAEKQAREKLEAESADRYARGRQAALAKYQREVERIDRETPLGPRQIEAERLVQAWVDGGKAEPSPELRQQQEAAIQALSASIGQLEDALSLATTKIENRLPLLFAADNEKGDAALVAMEMAKLNTAKLVMVRLCVANGDYSLARYLLGWAASTGLDRAQVEAEFGMIESAEGAKLATRKERILFALDDVRKGLSRNGRPFNGKLFDDYVFELVQYKDEQTATLLGAALLELAKQAGWGGDGKLAEPKEVLWTQVERDVATLCCRVLGRLGMGDAAVKALTPISTVMIDHRLVAEIGLALGNTGSASAWPPIIAMRDRFGLVSATSDALMASVRHLPIPELGPNADAEAYTNRGLLRDGMGDAAGAMSDYNEALKLDETFDRAYNNRGTLRLDLKQWTAALDDFNKALEFDKVDHSRARTYCNRGFAKRELGKNWDAIADFDLALKADPKLHRALVHRGYTYSDMGHELRALEDFSNALRENQDAMGALNGRATLFAMRGEFAKALNDFDAAINAFGSESVLYSNRGLTKSMMGRPDLAIYDFDHAIRINPRDPLAYLNRGAATWRLGNKDSLALALKDFEFAKSLAPDNKEAVEHLEEHLQLMALEAWLTKTPKSASERFTKSFAHSEYSYVLNGEAHLGPAAEECSKGLDEMGSSPSNDMKKEAVKALQALVQALRRAKRFADAYDWKVREWEFREVLRNPIDTVLNASFSAAMEAKRLRDSGNSSWTTWVDKCFEKLDMAIDVGYADDIQAENTHVLDVVRDDPRWPAVLEKIKAKAAEKSNAKSAVTEPYSSE